MHYDRFKKAKTACKKMKSKENLQKTRKTAINKGMPNT